MNESTAIIYFLGPTILIHQAYDIAYMHLVSRYMTISMPSTEKRTYQMQNGVNKLDSSNMREVELFIYANRC